MKQKHYVVRLTLFPQEFHISADNADEAEVKARERLLSSWGIPADKGRVEEVR